MGEQWSALMIRDGVIARTCGHLHRSQRTAQACLKRWQRMWAPIVTDDVVWMVRQW